MAALNYVLYFYRTLSGIFPFIFFIYVSRLDIIRIFALGIWYHNMLQGVVKYTNTNL